MENKSVISPDADCPTRAGTSKSAPPAEPHSAPEKGASTPAGSASGKGSADAVGGLLTVSVSPHIHAPDTTRTVMLDVLIALLPTLIWGSIRLGLRALLLTAVTVAASVFFEWGFEKLTRRPSTVSDLSAAVTGLLLALNLPVSLPIPMAIAGAFFAIVVVKQVFGGIGKNVFNPALAARVFLMLAWTPAMTAFTAVRSTVGYFDATSSATPLSALGQGKLPDGSVLDLFLGNNAGTIGEISILCLLLGGVWLLVRRVIDWRIPTCYLGTVALLTLIFPRVATVSPLVNMAVELCSGGLVLAALFMATDYVTSPVTRRGRVIFGIGCGLITVFIRYFGGYSEGVSFAVLIMNSLVWYLDRIGAPRVFGRAGGWRAARSASGRGSKAPSRK